MKAPRHLFPVTAALAALWLCGCSTPETRISRDPETFARLTSEQQSMIRSGQIGYGFTTEMVRLALGEPDRVHLRTDKSGTSEIWAYVSYEAPDDIGFYYGWYRRPPYWVGGGPFYPAPFYEGTGYQRERVDFRVVFRDGKAVAIEQRKR
jgi:hypothetical protein